MSASTVANHTESGGRNIANAKASTMTTPNNASQQIPRIQTTAMEATIASKITVIDLGRSKTRR